MKVLAISLFIMFVSHCSISAQDKELVKWNEIPGAYQFPVRPGMPEWKELKSRAEMTAACQIPEDILVEMPTEALVVTCLNHPMVGDFTAFNTYQQGIEALIRNSNGHGELMKRNDAGAAMSNVYDAMNLADFREDWTTFQKAVFIFQFMSIELLLGQDEVLSGMMKDEKNHLLDMCLLKYEYRYANQVKFGFSHLETSALLIGRLLLDADYAPFSQECDKNEKYRRFFDRASLGDVETIEKTVRYAKRYVMERTTGEE